jgi:hypothetical protein
MGLPHYESKEGGADAVQKGVFATKEADGSERRKMKSCTGHSSTGAVRRLTGKQRKAAADAFSGALLRAVPRSGKK